MTDNFASLALTIGDSILLSVIVKATLVAGTGLLAVAAMRRVRASRRSLVLAWTFVVLAGLPVVALGGGRFTVVVRETTALMTPAPGVPPELVPARPTNERPDVEAAVMPRPSDSTTGRDRVPWEGLAAGAWAAGFVVCLLPMLGTMRRLRLQRRGACVWRANGSATVLQHAEVSAPMTYGLLRPVILLPQDLTLWSEPDIERALVHELEHVRRRDWLVHLFARFVCAFYWFHPVVWHAWRRMYLEADRACDDAVVSGGSGQEFAEQLVALAGRVASGVPTLVPSMAAGDLSRRVMAMVNPHQARGRTGATCARLVAVMAMAIGAAIAPVKAVEGTTIISAPVTPVSKPAQSPVDRNSGERVPSQTTPVVRLAPAGQPQRPPASVAPPPVVDIQVSISEAPPEYTLSVGDVLVIGFYRNPELSAEVIVRPDGRITLPLIAPLLAAGLTPEMLRERITAEMKQFIQEPRPTVTVKQFTSPQVFIVGEVAKQGAYPLISPTTVLQLIALAGGPTKDAVKDKIVVIRSDGQSLTFDYNAVARREKLEQNIQLRPGDQVVVP